MKQVCVGLLAITTMIFAAFSFAEQSRTWKKLAKDGLHDPRLPALRILQEPVEALSELPYDYVGNQVLWNEALAEGYINPRTNLYPDTKIRTSDLVIIMGNTGEAGLVRFPHREHTAWLDCSNCHNHIFIDKVDANPINMQAILNGEYCGVCHGAVSFPLVECIRCHSVPRSKFKGSIGAQPAHRANSETDN